MKKSLIAIALFIAASAHATVFGDTTNNHGGRGGDGGDGGHAAASAGAAAAASAKAQATGVGVGIATGVNKSQQSTSVVVEAEQNFRTAATAYAAPLAASNGTCMGSSSVGAQGTFGLSFGTTWTDDSCDMRYDAESLRALGQPVAALARLCQKPEIAAAMSSAGTPCPSKPAPTAGVQKPWMTDPLVRAREGLAPL